MAIILMVDSEGGDMFIACHEEQGCLGDMMQMLSEDRIEAETEFPQPRWKQRSPHPCPVDGTIRVGEGVMGHRTVKLGDD